MLLMVIEHFRDNDMVPVYRRVREQGRGFPEGLKRAQTPPAPASARIVTFISPKE
jgi:hypothetical protein